MHKKNSVFLVSRYSDDIYKYIVNQCYQDLPKDIDLHLNTLPFSNNGSKKIDGVDVCVVSRAVFGLKVFSQNPPQKII